MKNVLDEIASQRFNPNAFEEWQEYRKQLTDIVIEGTPEGSTLAIYGAGRCNDIDLARFADHFSEITLLDFDTAAMQEALEQYGVSGSAKIRTECFDFVGIPEEDYEKLAQHMSDVLDQTDEKELYEGKLEPVIGVFYTALKEPVYRAPRYDAVLAAGLHSQLNQTAVSMWRNLCRQRGIATDPLRDPVSALMHRYSYPIIVRFDQLLFYSARDKSFIAYEQGIEGRVGHVQGAMQLEDDLERRMRLGQITRIRRHEAVWPQNRANDMVFHMAIDEFVMK